LLKSRWIWDGVNGLALTSLLPLLVTNLGKEEVGKSIDLAMLAMS
jgi:hypothetical protein